MADHRQDCGHPAGLAQLLALDGDLAKAEPKKLRILHAAPGWYAAAGSAA